MEQLATDDPARLGRYRVTARLGSGPSGRVLLGVDEAGRRVALTVVSAASAAEPGFRERFRREVRAAATAPAWFVAPVLDADTDGDPPWVATSYVEGPTLRAYVDAHGPLGQQGTFALAVRMADGLVALHAAGLVHRNLEPANVLLADDGPRVLEVGVVRAAESSESRGFGSPEQADGRPDVGPASDMFSFGAVIGYAATGRSPLAAGEPDLGPMSGPLRDIVLACLAADPAARPTAAQVRDQLRTLDDRDPTPVVGVPVEDPPTVATPVVAAPVIAAAPPEPPTVGNPVVDAPTVATPVVASTMIGPPLPAPPPPPSYGSPGPPPNVPGPHPRGRRRVPIAAIVAAAVAGVAAVVVVVLLLSWRSGDRDPIAATTTAVAPTGTPAPAQTSARPSDPAAGAVLIDAATDNRFGSAGARFATPSRNIACAMDADEVRCDVVERTWRVPAAPDCDLAFGTGAVLVGSEEGRLSCVGDTVADPSLAVLSYGEAVRSDGVVCVSRESGLRCENPDTRHGFRVSRGAYELF